MAVQSYEVVGALREMLQSQERREQSKVQTALASMQMAQRSREFGLQFAQQKKMQDVQLAGQQLQFLQNVNTQMMGSEATRFLTSSGLGALYNESDDGVESAIKILTKKPKIKDVGENGYIDIFNQHWRDFVSQLWYSNLLITGRHHEMYAACKAECPFVVIEGNTHKNQGLFKKLHM